MGLQYATGSKAGLGVSNQEQNAVAIAETVFAKKEQTKGLYVSVPSTQLERKTMFDEIPTDVPEEYLSGLAGFVASGGERTEDMSKTDYIYALNQLSGCERVPAEEDGRASQKVVPEAEAGEEAITQEEYTNSVFEEEARSWATTLLEADNDGEE